MYQSIQDHDPAVVLITFYLQTTRKLKSVLQLHLVSMALLWPSCLNLKVPLTPDFSCSACFVKHFNLLLYTSLIHTWTILTGVHCPSFSYCNLSAVLPVSQGCSHPSGSPPVCSIPVMMNETCSVTSRDVKGTTS